MSLKTIQAKLDEGRQYRNIDVSSFERRADDDKGEKIVEGYATTFNQPYQLWSYDGYTVMEQIDARAFDDCDMSDVIMQYDHEGRVFARISNETLSLNADKVGLKIRANLGGTEIGRELFEEIQGGYTTKMSFGFKVGEDKREVTENHEDNTVTVLRTITKITKLYDVSAVSLPANDATSISARSYFDGLIEELKSERLAHEKRERQKKQIKILLEM
jgi:hypothetical protein